MKIAVDPMEDGEIEALMRDHLVDMHATSPPESVHALNLDELVHPDITFWSAREDGKTLACIALKALGEGRGEIKSMRTTGACRGRGVGSALLKTLLAEARLRGYHTVLLETGSQDFFAPARRLYERFGFSVCGPFADYVEDPNSVFMALNINN